jgi:hypothetical protein
MIADATNLKSSTTIIDQFLNLKCHLPKGARVFAPLPGILESPGIDVRAGSDYYAGRVTNPTGNFMGLP